MGRRVMVTIVVSFRGASLPYISPSSSDISDLLSASCSVSATARRITTKQASYKVTSTCR